ncbi:uncharacterized protein LOC143297628 [Babylonia areolata]|uniref:uncharacterized protein LOC143297628 n=1 Tax=Babylonia areolata TaxID=304850 RepID=UPI003FD3EA8D
MLSAFFLQEPPCDQSLSTPMEPKKTTMKTWYMTPSWDRTRTPEETPQSSAHVSSVQPVPSSPGVPLPPVQYPPPVSLPVPLLPRDAPASARSPVSPLPAFASFLPRYRSGNGLRVILSTRAPTGVRPSVPDSTLRAPHPAGHAVPLLSTGPCPTPAKSLLSAQARPATARHITTKSAARETVGMCTSGPSVTRAVPTELVDAVTSSSSQHSSLGFFRPVGVVLKTSQSPSPVSLTSPARYHPGGGQTRVTSSAFLYCAPPASPHGPWTSSTTTNTSWVPGHPWPRDRVMLDSKGQACPYGQLMPNNKTAQPNYGVYPFSQVYPPCQTYPGRGPPPLQTGSTAGRESDLTFQEEIPSQSAYTASRGPAFPLYDAGTDVKNMQYAGDADSNAKEMAFPGNEGCINSGVKSAPYPCTTTGCISSDVSVVTVRADDSSVFMANTAGTTSQTEREFSLHDAKMQLAEATSMSDCAPPPSSPYSSLCTLSCGGSADRLQVQPTPGDEVKPHPGLDMLSDVSLLVESLTSQGSNGRSKDSQCAAASSGSSTAISSLGCGSYPSEEETEPVMCMPRAAYIGSVPPDPDSTITLATATQVDDNLLPGEDLEYTTMTPASVLQGMCCPMMEDLQQQYTLMLPPKKSSKFTKGSGADPQPVQSSDSSHNPRSSDKLPTNTAGRQSEKPGRRGRPRKKTEHQDEDDSKTRDSGTRKRAKSQTSKRAMQNCVPAAGSHNLQPPHRQVMGQSTNHGKQKEMSAQNQARAEGGGSSDTEQGLQLAVDQTQMVCESYDAENSLIKTDPADGLTESVAGSSGSLLQLGAGGDGPVYDVSKSEDPEHGVPFSTQLSVTQMEAGGVACGDGTRLADSPHDLHLDDADDMCPKVHFDPLVIAEEEVTSTQPHDHVILTDDATDVSTEDGGRVRKTKWRRRSHSCVSCYSFPSSDEEDSSPSDSTAPCTSNKSRRPTKSGTQSCRRCRRSVKGKSTMLCDVCERLFSSSSGKQRVKTARGDKDKLGLMCQVCGRAFSSLSNLSRHQRLFHPSIFLANAPIVELPLVSPQLRTTSSSTSASASSVTSTDSTPPLLSPTTTTTTTRSVKCLSPSPPFATATLHDKTPPTPHNSPSNSPSADDPEEGALEEMCGREDQTEHSDEPGTGHVPRRQRRQRRTAMKQEDKDWEPPKKKLESEGSVVSQIKTRHGTHHRPRARSARTGTTQKARHKAGATISSHSQPLNCTLNFRTKKRTRINSTIPCPHCDRMFSVMSNLKRHTKQQHNDVNVFKCNVCSLKMNMRRKLNKHMKNHANAYPHACVECLSRFRSEAEMRSHRKDHEISRFPCDDCSLVFYTEEHLGDHIAQYHVTLAFQ